MNEMVISPLGHTWLLDLDGTLLKQNGFKGVGDEFLPGALEFLKRIPDDDCVIFLTAREEIFKEVTEDFLNKNNVKYRHIIFGLPNGERIVINDIKPSGLKTAIAHNVKRDEAMNLKFSIDKNL